MSKNIFRRSNDIIIAKLTMPVTAFFLLVLIGSRSDVLLGEYAVVTTWFFILQSLPFLGLTAFVVREVARQPGKAGSYFTMMSAISLMGCGLLNLLIRLLFPFLHYSPTISESIIVVGYAIIPGILSFLSETLLISLGRTRPIAVIAIVENTVRLLASAVVLFRGGTVVSLIWVFFLTRLFSLCMYLFYFFFIRRIPIIGPLEIALFKKMFSVLPSFFTNTVLALIVTRFDYIVLSLYATTEQCGYYAIAYRVLDISLLIIMSIILALFPNLSREFVNSSQRFAEQVRNLMSFAITLLVPLSLLGYVLSDMYIRVFFAHQYPAPVDITRIFCLVVIIVGLDALLSSFLQASDRQNDDLKALGAGSVIYIVALLVLVPRYGAIGAAISMPFASFTQAALKFRFLYRRLGVLETFGGVIWYIVKGAVCFVPIFFLVKNGSPTALVIAALLALIWCPFIMLLGSLARMGEIVTILWRGATVRPIKTLAGCIDHIVADIRRYRDYFPVHASPDKKNFYPCSGLCAAVLHRFSHYFYLKKMSLLSRFFWQLNLFLTKADIPRTTYFGAGVVFLAPLCMGISAVCGERVTFAKLAGVGISGKIDAGRGPGITDIRDDVFFGTRTGALGGITIPPKTILPPHTLLHRLSVANRFFNAGGGKKT